MTGLRSALLAALLPLGAAAAPRPVKLLLGDTISDLPLFVALDQGYFREAGVAVEMIRMRMYSDGRTRALAQGVVDVSKLVYSAPLNELMPKTGFRMVAGNNRTVKGRRQNMCLLVRKDLAGKVKTYADLKGRAVGMPAPGVELHMRILRGLKEAGLGIKDVVVRPIPPSAQLFVAKAVDVGAVWEPLASRLVAEGVAEVFAGTDVADWSGQMSGLFYSRQFRQDRERGTRFMAAYVRAMRACHSLPRAELVAIANKYLPEAVTPDDLDILIYPADGSIDTESIMGLQREAQRWGLIKAPLDADSLFDLSFLKAAQSLDRVIK